MKTRGRVLPISLFSFQDIITGLCGLLILFVLIMIIDLVLRRDAGTVLSADSRESAEAVQAESERLRHELESVEKELSEARRKRSIAVSDEQRQKSEKVLSEKDRELANLMLEIRDLETRLEKVRDANAKSRQKLVEMEATRRRLEDELTKLHQRNGVTLIPERGNLKSPVYVVLGGNEVRVMAPLDRNARPTVFGADRIYPELRMTLSRLDASTHTVVVLVRPSGVEYMDAACTIAKSLGFAYGRDPLEEDVELSFAMSEGAS